MYPDNAQTKLSAAELEEELGVNWEEIACQRIFTASDQIFLKLN